MFDHEKFEAYQLAIPHWGTTLELLRVVPPGCSSVKDQLMRAASSIPLNSVHSFQSHPEIITLLNLLGLHLLLPLLQIFRAWAGAGRGEMLVDDITIQRS